MSSDLLKNAISRVLERLDGVTKHTAVVGLDGFIDKIQKPVASQSESVSTYYQSLDSFGQRIREAAGQSAQIELHTKTVKLGGNAPIFANALARLSIKNTCLGTFGRPQMHPVFQETHPDCELISLGNAAETNALEFDDGKLILSELSTFRDLDWEQIKQLLDIDQLRNKASKANLIGLVDWCNLPHASNIWSGFFEDVVQTHIQSKPHFFFDLADPSKKSKSEIHRVVSIINRFEKYGPVTLGLNENEAKRLASVFASSPLNVEQTKLAEFGQLIFDHMEITQLLIHPLDGCYLFSGDQTHYLEGRIVKQPSVSTGGGDNFNAGFCFGILNKFGLLESMVTAMAASGWYVQNGASPTTGDLSQYLQIWLEEIN